MIGTPNVANITASVIPDVQINGNAISNTEITTRLGTEIVIERTDVRPATTDTLGGIIVGDDLLITSSGRLSVDKATSVSQDNTKPITAAAVYTEIGNINALLATI